MTISYKLPPAALTGPRHSFDAGHASRPAREQAAPALFRLLSESALYRAVFSACDMALGIVDARSPRLQFVQVNRAFERFFGFHGSDACRYSVAALLLNCDLGLERRLFGETAMRARVVIKRRDGSTLPVEITIDPLRNSAGTLTHWAVSFAGLPEREPAMRPLGEAFAPQP